MYANKILTLQKSEALS